MKLKHSIVLIAGASLFYKLSWTDVHFYCKGKRSSKPGKSYCPTTQNARISQLSVSRMLTWYSKSFGLETSAHFHWVHSAAAILSWELLVVTNYAPKEQYTIIAYIQYNQDWIRKIQVQNDYIQEDSTSTKGYYSCLGN